MSSEITIRDVAASAGCSIATVSRVVTGNGPVSEEMRRRVVEAALAVGFPLARAFPETRPVISILVPSLTNPVFAAAVAGIERRARAAGMFTILGQSNYDPAQEEDIVTTLIGERPVGMIMTVCDPASSVALQRVRKAGLPVVTVYNEDTPEGVAAVMVDNRGALRRATDDLIALGHRRILFLAGKFISSDRSARRYEGYRDAMMAARLTAAPAIEVDQCGCDQRLVGRHRHTRRTGSRDPAFQPHAWKCRARCPAPSGQLPECRFARNHCP